MATNEASQSFARFQKSLSAYDINFEPSIRALSAALDSIAGELAQRLQNRKEFGAYSSVWPDLRRLWRDLVHAQLSFWDDSEGDEADDQSDRPLLLRRLCLSVSRFTRNLVAGVPHNQGQAFENEPDIRRLLHYYSSWSAAEDQQTLPVTWMLTQTLSNLVTCNEALMTNLWELYLGLPEDQVILIRLLTFPDHKTILSALVFIMNCIKGSKKRIKMLCRTAIGSRLCIAIVDVMVRLYDAAELSDGAQAFNIGYGIFSQVIEKGYVSDLYSKFSMVDEPVTPHQTTLLKIIDSYLQSRRHQKSGIEMSEVHSMLSPLLARVFLSSSAYAQATINHSLRSSPTDTPPTVLDPKLPKVCEALVLMTQCIITISLAAGERKAQEPTKSNGRSQKNLKDYFNEQHRDKQGMVESLVGLLRLLDLFLPRINFGKLVTSSPLSGEKTHDEGHVVTGFSYLKRDLVRLLAILSHRARGVQDRVRDCGGIPIIMNLCVVDERNPYLKEHAVLALRNLLENNLENQNVVDSIRPVDRE